MPPFEEDLAKHREEIERDGGKAPVRASGENVMIFHSKTIATVADFVRSNIFLAPGNNDCRQFHFSPGARAATRWPPALLGRS
jgi:hypothetical protein